MVFCEKDSIFRIFVHVSLVIPRHFIPRKIFFFLENAVRINMIVFDRMAFGGMAFGRMGRHPGFLAPLMIQKHL